MQCEYNVTYKDFRESMKGYRKVSRGAAVTYYVDMWALPGLGIVAALVFLIARSRGTQEYIEMASWMACVLITLGVVGVLTYTSKSRAAYRQRTSLSDDGKVVMNFDSDSVRFTLPGRADISYQWSSITQYSETARVITLFIKKAAFHTVPKRAMNDDGWSAFRALVQQHAGRV